MTTLRLTSQSATGLIAGGEVPALLLVVVEAVLFALVDGFGAGAFTGAEAGSDGTGGGAADGATLGGGRGGFGAAFWVIELSE